MGNELEIKKESETPTNLLEKKAEKFSDTQKKDVGQLFDKEINISKTEHTKIDNEDEILKKETYKKNKTDLIQNIIGRRLNPDFHNENDPRVMEYNNKVLLSENITQVKAYLAYYNLQTTKGNILNKTQNPIIQVDDFMRNFNEEQTKDKKTIEEKSEVVAISPERARQEVGKFIDIDTEKQQRTIGEMEKLMAAQQKINKLTIYGYADATQVTKEGKEKVKEKFTALRNILIDKGISEKIVPSAEYFNSIDTMSDIQQQKVFNEGWAYTRAMMQIAFLPSNQIKYINDNSSELSIHIDAKPIGGTEKGNQYTGGMIEMESTGGDKIIKLLEEKEHRLLKMIDMRQVNYLYRIDGDRKTGIADSLHFLGGIHLGVNTNIPGRKEGLDIFRVNHTAEERRYGESGWYQYGQDAYLEPNTKVNTLNIIIPKDDARITNTGITIPDGFEGYISALTEFKKNSKGDKAKETYIESTIQIMQTYKDVETELNDAKEIKKIII